MESPKIVADFFHRLADIDSVLGLFDLVPDAYFYVKDRESRFVKMNDSLLRLRGLKNEREVWGKTDWDLHPAHWARQYVEEDRRVMEAGQGVVNQPWLVPDDRGRLRWFLSSKVPLFDRSRVVIGIAGVMRDFEKTEQLTKPYQQMERVLAHVARHYRERLTVDEIAKIADLSVSQLDRRFKQLFQMTPQQYVIRVRVHEATRRLLETDHALGVIALETGFYDQAHFTRAFKALMGCSPSAYRMSAK